jgi:serine protease inhibitor
MGSHHAGEATDLKGTDGDCNAKGTLSLEDYITSGQAWADLTAYVSGTFSVQRGRCKVYMPPMSITTEGVDLNELLQHLGIENVFESSQDFDPLIKDAVGISQAIQSTRLDIGKKGIEGASYMAMT